VNQELGAGQHVSSFIGTGGCRSASLVHEVFCKFETWLRRLLRRDRQSPDAISREFHRGSDRRAKRNALLCFAFRRTLREDAAAHASEGRSSRIEIIDWVSRVVQTPRCSTLAILASVPESTQEQLAAEMLQLAEVFTGISYTPKG
jgi:hypothetical protein